MKLSFHFTPEQESLLILPDIAPAYKHFLGEVMLRIQLDYSYFYDPANKHLFYTPSSSNLLDIQIAAPRMDEMHPDIQTLPPKCLPLTPFNAASLDFALTVYILEMPVQGTTHEAHVRRLVYRLVKSKFVLVEDSDTLGVLDEPVNYEFIE